MEQPEFAYTGPMPPSGYVGFVNLTVTEGGIRFTVRSEGDAPTMAAYEVPADEAVAMLRAALDAL